MAVPIQLTSPPGTADPLVFTIKAATLRFDSRDEIEPYLRPLMENADVEEVHLSGNTYGIEACKFLGEILSTKKKLKVLPHARLHSPWRFMLMRLGVGRTVRRYLLNTLANRNPSIPFLSSLFNSKSPITPYNKPFRQRFWINRPRTANKLLFTALTTRTSYSRQQRSRSRSRIQHRKRTGLTCYCKVSALRVRGTWSSPSENAYLWEK